jgi:6-phosphogluconolactonase
MHSTSHADSPKPEKAWVFLGTYTGATSKGIYRCEMDLATGNLSEPQLAAEVATPSFLAVHPSRKFLYAVGELEEFAKKKQGAVYAFALDPKTGELTKLNQQGSGGPGPCHIVVDKARQNVLVANYSGGSAACLPIDGDGSLRPASSVVQHTGKGSNPDRQEGPHAHSINLDARNNFAFVADLGLDQVRVYKFDPTNGKLTPNDPPFVALAAGAGPRHFAFHPNGKFAYVINELASTVTAMTYDADHGRLEKLQTITTLPPDFKGETTTAEVVVHPSGKFLYGSNRGQDSIVAYSIDPTHGTLTLIGHQKDGVKVPRNFNIDPTGRFLVVANQDSDSVVVFAIADNGELKPTEHKVAVGKPVCVRFVPVMK